MKPGVDIWIYSNKDLHKYLHQIFFHMAACQHIIYKFLQIWSESAMKTLRSRNVYSITVHIQVPKTHIYDTSIPVSALYFWGQNILNTYPCTCQIYGNNVYFRISLTFNRVSAFAGPNTNVYSNIHHPLI